MKAARRLGQRLRQVGGGGVERSFCRPGSFGGAATAEFCLDDARCVAGINFDGSLSGDVERVGLKKPFMQVFPPPAGSGR